MRSSGKLVRKKHDDSESKSMYSASRQNLEQPDFSLSVRQFEEFLSESQKQFNQLLQVTKK
jgi:hypothetical protein